jgi:hypothetical protein
MEAGVLYFLLYWDLQVVLTEILKHTVAISIVHLDFSA